MRKEIKMTLWQDNNEEKKSTRYYDETTPRQTEQNIN